MSAIRWHGRGGQGCFTAARLLGAAAVAEGKYALAFPSFGPERRGAPVLGFTRLSAAPITDRSEICACDAVVVLDDSLLGPAVIRGLAAGGVLIVNTRAAAISFLPAGRRLVTLDAGAIAQEHLGRPIVNTVMLGALIAATRVVSIESVAGAVTSDATIKQADRNIAALKQGWCAAKGTV